MEIKRTILLCLIFWSILFVGDFSSARYGKGIMYKKTYSKLPFQFYIEFYEAKFNIQPVLGYFHIIHSNSYFSPNGKTKLFVNHVLAFSVVESKLLVWVKDDKNKDVIIEILSIHKEGFVDDYNIIKEEYLLTDLEWLKLNRNFFLMLQVNWSVTFYLLFFLNMYITYSLFKRTKSNIEVY